MVLIQYGAITIGGDVFRGVIHGGIFRGVICFNTLRGVVTLLISPQDSVSTAQWVTSQVPQKLLP